jgi:predicted GIY-YIG superfamily endonuclease
MYFSPKSYFVYIMTNRSKTLYTGVTKSLERRVWEHKLGEVSEFAAKYKVDRVVYFSNRQHRIYGLNAEGSSEDYATLGFEDLFGGGDFDYNDALFLLEGSIGFARVPEPASLTLLLFGLTAVALRVRSLSGGRRGRGCGCRLLRWPSTGSGLSSTAHRRRRAPTPTSLRTMWGARVLRRSERSPEWESKTVGT